MAAGKECTFIALDVSPTMAPHVEEAKELVEELICSRALYRKQDTLGLCLMGSAETENELAAELGGYDHLSVVHKVSPVSFDAVATLRAAPAGDAHADVVDALILSADAVMRYVRKLKFSKRVILITDGRSDAELDEIEDVTCQMRDNSIELEVVACGGPAAEEAVSTQLVKLSEALGALMTVVPLAAARRKATALQVKPVRPWSSFKGSLEIGSLQLPVQCWRKVSKLTSVAFKQVSRNSLTAELEGGDANPKDSISTETRFFLQAAPETDIPPEERINGYRLGRDVLPLSTNDEGSLKYGVDKGEAQLIGFVPRQQVPRHLLLDTSDCLVGNPASNGAEKAVQALCLTLEDKDLVGIIRWAPRKGNAPRMACLWPAMRCLYVSPLPFAGEVRALQWPPQPQEEPSEEQISAAAGLIDAFDLTGAGEGGAKNEWARPKDVVDPHHARVFQCIRHKAVNGGASLPPADWRAVKPLATPDTIANAAGPALERFAAVCPSGAPKEKKAGGKRLWDEKAEDVGKKPKAEPSGYGGYGNGTSAGGAEALKPLPSLQQSVVSGVDSAAPVETFWRLIRDEHSDRTLEAFSGMRDVALSLLRQAYGVDDALAQKAFRCLREMRRAAVQEEEPAPYNDLLALLKAEFSVGAKAAFWEQIGEDAGPGLIHLGETPESSVTVAEAKAFLQASQPTPATREPEPEPAAQDDEDDFDGLE